MPLYPPPKVHESRPGICRNAKAISISSEFSGTLPPQGYRIEIRESGISVQASDPAGQRYAEATITQLNVEGRPPRCGVIEDWPDYAVRGYMLDISRCKVPTMAHLHRLVDLLAALRFNQLQLYMEHTFAYRQHRQVWQSASPMTAAEIRDLARYCSERGLELVPNQNSFGHMERWLKHRAYRYLAECPNGFEHPISGHRPVGSVLYPDQHALDFVDGLYAELLPNFSSDHLHIGCDEPWELGQGRSREVVARRGKQSLYLEHVRKLSALAQGYGKKAYFWADILLERPDLLTEAPEGAVPVIWGYDVDHPFEAQCATLARAGMAFHVAPGDATWKCFSGRVETTLENQKLAARTGKAHGAEGYLLTHWGDLGHHQTWPTSLPGMILGAGLAWNAAEDPEPYLIPVLDQLCFCEGGAMPSAKLLLALGGLDARVPRILVGSWFYDALFAEPTAISTASLDDLSMTLDRFEETHSGLRCGANDADWLKDELAQAIAMTRMAVRRVATGSAWRSQRDRSAFLLKFQEIWLRRNRPGGLSESLRYFQQVP